MAHFILTESKIFCPHCENEVVNEGLKLVNNDYFIHECGAYIQNPLPKNESNLLVRLENLNIDFGIDEDTLQDYVNLLYKAIKNLSKEPIDQIGHEEYVEKTEYKMTDPLEKAKEKKEVFLTHINKN